VKTRLSGMKWALSLSCVAILALAGCSRQQSDWDKARTANDLESFEQFVKKYPSGDFTAQAQARVKELEEERDWQKARDADTPDAYQAFLKQYSQGKWTEEARIRIENFSLAQAPAGSATNPDGTPLTPSVADAGAPAAVDKPVAKSTAPAKTEPSAKHDNGTKHAAPAKSDHGTYAVQLGAYSSGKSAAEQGWKSLQSKYGTALKSLSHRVVSGKGPKGTVYRLQATGLTKSHAESVCASLKAKSQACIVVAP
jgi:SPOR domain